jgi:hypothetical protein
MNNPKDGLIFCSKIEQISQISFVNLRITPATKINTLEVFNKYINIQDEEIRSKYQRYFLKNIIDNPYLLYKAESDYQSYIASHTPMTYTSSCRLVFFPKLKPRARVKLFNIFEITNFRSLQLFLLREVYTRISNQSLSEVIQIRLKNNQNNNVFAVNLNKINLSFKNAKDNAFNNFTSLLNKIFGEILTVINPNARESENKKAIQLIGVKHKRDSKMLIEVPYQRISVINFIKELGLDNFFSEYLNIPTMVEAIKQKELGNYQLFKEYTINAVNRALILIERKLLDMSDEQRIIALHEMNNLDSLKFIVELIQEEERVIEVKSLNKVLSLN